MQTFADKVIAFNKSLDFKGALPEGIRIMNPFKEDDKVMGLSSAFYKKFYNDTNRRHLILGINPGRFGGGVTGVMFTDPKRLQSICGIAYPGKETHEPSSVFVYDVIQAYGGAERFYADFYIHSLCPLGFTIAKPNGKEVNYNYYDSKELQQAVYPFIIANLKKQLQFGIASDVCFCMGTGKNEKFLRQVNEEHNFFKTIIAVEHPRFIMQYKAKSKQLYIDKYLQAFSTKRLQNFSQSLVSVFNMG